jgi:SAM-dependent methyltransferase
VIEHDNLDEFQDPANYDLEEIPRSLARIAYHVQLARGTGGPVLELACGSGIVALPIASRTGLHVTGVDLAPPMLAHAGAKALAEGLDALTTWLHGDARDVRLEGAERRYALCYLTGNAFQAFLSDDDQQTLLATVAHHLRDDGVFAFDTRNPAGTDLAHGAEEAPWGTFTNVDGHPVMVSGLQRYDTATQLMHWTTLRRWHDGEQAHETTTQIACRFTPPEALDALLPRAGFEVVARYGDWDRSAFRTRSEHIINVCRRRR